MFRINLLPTAWLEMSKYFVNDNLIIATLLNQLYVRVSILLTRKTLRLGVKLNKFEDTNI
jgi:hypothetical protein